MGFMEDDHYGPVDDRTVPHIRTKRNEKRKPTGGFQERNNNRDLTTFTYPIKIGILVRGTTKTEDFYTDFILYGTYQYVFLSSVVLTRIFLCTDLKTGQTYLLNVSLKSFMTTFFTLFCNGD